MNPEDKPLTPEQIKGLTEHQLKFLAMCKGVVEDEKRKKEEKIKAKKK